MAGKEIRRGQVYYADLNPVFGHEQGGRRPVLVIQNDVGNRYSTTVIVAAITSQIGGRAYPTEVRLRDWAAGLERESLVRLDQIRTLDKRLLERFVGQLEDAQMRSVDAALGLSLGLKLADE